MNEYPIAAEIADQAAQRDKLAAFFRAHPLTYFTQDELSKACGADIGAVRSRVSNCKIELGMRFESYRPLYEKDGKQKRGKKCYRFLPYEPLGPPAEAYRTQQGLF